MAETFQWNDPIAGDWEDSTNWTLSSGVGTAPPDVGDTATFALPNVYTVNYLGLFGTHIWELDRLQVLGGVVTVKGIGGGTSPTDTFLNIETGSAVLEVNGGHLILRDEPGNLGSNSLDVTIGELLSVRDGLMDIDRAVNVETSRMSLGIVGAGQTGELRVFNGASLDVTSAADSNTLGLNGAFGLLTIDDGTVNLAGETRLGVSAVSGSAGAINMANASALFVDDVLMGGTNIGATGAVTLQGTAMLQQSGASTWDVGGTAGAGVINIQDAATFDTGTGEITLNTTGDINLSGGTLQADGFLNFQGGRLDMTGGELIINNGMDAIAGGGVFNLAGGTVRVEGGLAKFETSLNFGGPSDSERANVIIEDGNQGQVQFAFRIGRDAGTFGRAEIRGNGTTLIGTGGGAGADLIVGENGDGELVISDSALANLRDDFVIGDQATANGYALVANSATIDVTNGSNSQVSIGRLGTGRLDIRNGGLVQTDGDVVLAAQSGGNATVTVLQGSCSTFPLPGFTTCSNNDATLQSGDDLLVGGGSSTAGGTASLTVDDGGLVVVPNLMRIYGGATVNLKGGKIDVGNLDFQGGATINFTGGELHFPTGATFDTNLVAGVSGGSNSHDAGLISVLGTMTLANPMTIDGGNVSTDTLVVDALTTHHSGLVEVDTANLNGTYLLDGGKLSLRTGTNLGANLDFQSGTLELTDSGLVVVPGGLLGASINLVTGATIENLGTTLIQTAGQLQTSGGVYEAVEAVNIAPGGTLNNQGTLRARSDLVVQSGATLDNSGEIILLATPAGNLLSGSIQNSGSIIVESASRVLNADGLTLTGGGELRSGFVFASSLDGNDTATINNTDNVLLGSSSTLRLTIANAQLTMGPTALIGAGVWFDNVDLLQGGTIDTSIGSGGGVVFDSGSTIDGVVEVTGAVSMLTARVLPTGEFHLQPVSLWTASASGFDFDGRLRAEQGAIVNLATPGTYDFSGGTISLSDDSTHMVDPNATLVLSAPIEFDNLTVIAASSGFVGALYGAEPMVSTGEALQVVDTTTLDTRLVVDGGTFTTGSLVNLENLDLRTGEFRLTADDFVVSPATTGATFVIGSGAKITVDETVELVTASRLAIVGGSLHAQGNSGTSLTNTGDLDVIDGVVTLDAPATNNGDLNAIDSTLTFTGGLINNGNINLINSTVDGNLINGTSGSMALLGANSFGDNLVLSDRSSVFIDIAGDQQGEFDVVTVDGDATLDGVLNVSLSNDFMLAPGQQFTVLTAAEITDNGLALGGTATNEFSLIIGSTSVILRAIDLPGDYNADGVVDAADYTIWRDNLGAAAGTLVNDPNPGVIGPAQYATWEANFGNISTTSSQSNTPVPEPSTSVLLTLFAPIIIRRCRQARH